VSWRLRDRLRWLQTGDSTFPLLAGKNATLRLKDLDSELASVLQPTPYENLPLLASNLLMGRWWQQPAFTRRRYTVTVGTDIFLSDL